MSEKDAFTFLFEILKGLNKVYVENVMATLGFVLLGMGWVVTSDKAREFLGSTNLVRWGAIGFIVIIAIIHSFISIAIYGVSIEKFEQLVALDYAISEYFEVYRLREWQVVLCLVMNLSAFGLLGGLILNSKPKESS